MSFRAFSFIDKAINLDKEFGNDNIMSGEVENDMSSEVRSSPASVDATKSFV